MHLLKTTVTTCENLSVKQVHMGAYEIQAHIVDTRDVTSVQNKRHLGWGTCREHADRVYHVHSIDTSPQNLHGGHGETQRKGPCTGLHTL